MLFVLHASNKKASDLQRLVCYDYLLVHSRDVDGGPNSLHPSVPFRGIEFLVKRDLIKAGLNLMYSRELVTKTFDVSGITYSSNELTAAFVALLSSVYAQELMSRANWVIERFGEMSEAELSNFMSDNVGRWGAEFEHLTAVNDVEL